MDAKLRLEFFCLFLHIFSDRIDQLLTVINSCRIAVYPEDRVVQIVVRLTASDGNELVNLAAVTAFVLDIIEHIRGGHDLFICKADTLC